MQTQQDMLEEFVRQCHERGLAVTIQRRKVLETLIEQGGHPTADEIYEALRHRVPGLSRATVYRVLQTLVEVGMARKVCHPCASARYEPYKGQHHHLVCLDCGKMIDFINPALDTLPLPDPRKTGFRTSDFSVQFRGLCEDCRRTLRRMPPAGTPRPRSAPTPKLKGRRR